MLGTSTLLIFNSDYKWDFSSFFLHDNFFISGISEIMIAHRDHQIFQISFLTFNIDNLSYRVILQDLSDYLPRHLFLIIVHEVITLNLLGPHIFRHYLITTEVFRQYLITTNFFRNYLITDKFFRYYLITDKFFRYYLITDKFFRYYLITANFSDITW